MRLARKMAALGRRIPRVKATGVGGQHNEQRQGLSKRHIQKRGGGVQERGV